MLTNPPLPLNATPLPVTPGVQAGSGFPERLPVFPLLEESDVVLPEPSSNSQKPWRPLTTVTVTFAEAVPAAPVQLIE